MAEWSQSVFMQALGWATINSFWQMGLLWFFYLLLNQLFKPAAAVKYKLAAASIFIGFGWFCFSFFTYQKTSGSFAAITVLPVQDSYLHVFLVSASVTYLILLVFPAYRLLRNWRFVQKIKTEGIKKAAFPYRIFVQKISSQLNIRKKVLLFVSEIVDSPVTIGYLRPIILLPVAALNHLSTTQAEAILLHELSHIRRADYLVNFLINIVSTVLYFNPFVKLFMQQLDAEREACCDELVLQFGYDKLAYCSALLTLEKSARERPVLALGAAGKKNLLSRIEKIIGMPASETNRKKKAYSITQVLPALAALVCIFAFNSVLILHDTASPGKMDLTASTLVNPFYFIDNGASKKAEINVPVMEAVPVKTEVAKTKTAAPQPTKVLPPLKAKPPVAEADNFLVAPAVVSNPDHLIPVAYDEVENNLSLQQKQQVATTIDATKKILTTLQWKQVESSIADALDNEEKELVKKQYQKELANINWVNVEKNLKANYDKVDWQVLNTQLTAALTEIELEKLELKYRQILTELEKAEKEIYSSASTNCTALADQSIEDLRRLKAEVKQNLEVVKSLRENKVIRL